MELIHGIAFNFSRRALRSYSDGLIFRNYVHGIASIVLRRARRPYSDGPYNDGLIFKNCVHGIASIVLRRVDGHTAMGHTAMVLYLGTVSME
jgi:hypothetical protein